MVVVMFRVLALVVMCPTDVGIIRYRKTLSSALTKNPKKIFFGTDSIDTILFNDMILASVANWKGKHGVKIHWAAAAGRAGDRVGKAVPALAVQSNGSNHAGASVFLGRCRAGGVSGQG